MAKRARETWLEVLRVCRERRTLPASTMALWIEPACPTGIEDERLVLELPSEVYGWVARRYRRLLGELVRDVDATLAGVRLKQQPTQAHQKGANDG